MTTLETLGFICILLLCFGIPAYIIVKIYKKPKQDGSKKSNIYFPEYLLAILPVSLLLIGLLSNNAEEKINSLSIVSVFYPGVILFYTVRVVIPKINFIILTTCLLIALTGLYFYYYNIAIYMPSGNRVDSLLYFPILTYLYLLISRKIIFKSTGCYPLFVTAKQINYIHFDGKQDRQATYRDVIWSVASILFIIALGFILNII